MWHWGIPLVKWNLETLQWEENSVTRTSYDHSDRSLNKRVGVYCKGVSTWRKMVKRGEAFSHKCHSQLLALKLLALKFTILTFTKNLSHLTNSCSRGQQSCSGKSLQDRWYPQSTAFKNQQVNLELSADWESRNATDSNNWKLHQKVYLIITKLLGTPTVDLSAYMLCQLLILYMAWKPDPNSFATDVMQQDWNKMFAFAFPPFRLIGRVINKVLQENVEALILVTPTWQTQPWYTHLLRMSIQHLLVLPALPNLLLNPLGGKHPLVKTRSLRLIAWKNYRKTLQMEGISSNAA